MEFQKQEMNKYGGSEFSGEMVSIIDRNFKILYQNEFVKDYFGNHISECCYKIYKDHNHICVNCPLEKVFKSGKKSSAFQMYINADGNVHYYETTISPIEDGSKDVVAVLELIRDITEPDKLGKNIETKNNKVKDTDEKLKSLNGGRPQKEIDDNEKLSLLYELGQQIISSFKLNDILQYIVDRVSELLDLETCSILLINEKTNNLEIKCSKGLDIDFVDNIHIKLGEGISGWVAQNNEPVLIEDIEKDSRFARKNRGKYSTHSLISVPLQVKSNVVGVININNRKNGKNLTSDDLRFVQNVANEAGIAIENAQLYKNLEDTYIYTISALLAAIDAKDHYTAAHSQHVTKYALAIAREMGWDDNKIAELRQACLLHDIGKIGISDHILVKKGKLTNEEWEEMKTHSVKGAEILEPLPFLNEIIDYVKLHHERFDGRGYPYGYKENNIPVGARIITVADSFDAMVTERPYRYALPFHIAVSELISCSGTQFDPDVVQAFLKILDEKPNIFKN